MVRWVCGRCGSGTNAPERPRKNDVRRFCLKCSADTGFLVERTSPTLERRRAMAYQRGSEKAAKQRAAERERWIVELVDANDVTQRLNVRAELKRALTDCGFFEGWARGNKPTINDVEVIVRRGAKSHHSGHAWGNFRTTLTFGRGAGYEEALELIYHEAAHLAATDADHGSGFRRILVEAIQKRWPFIVAGSLRSGAAYDLDRRIVEQLRRHNRAGRL